MYCKINDYICKINLKVNELSIEQQPTCYRGAIASKVECQHHTIVENNYKFACFDSLQCKFVVSPLILHSKLCIVCCLYVSMFIYLCR